jgi:serine/threonine protein kinase
MSASAVSQNTLSPSRFCGKKNGGFPSSNQPLTFWSQTLKDQPTTSEIKAFLREAALMSPLSHPNVVSLVGVCTAGDPRMIALQFCEHGALLTYLKAHQFSRALHPLSKFHIMHDVAEGMAYLTVRHIIHRDLAARNILVNADYVCKVCELSGNTKPGVVASYLFSPRRFPTLGCPVR